MGRSLFYDYICLDSFREDKPHIAGELEKWLDFLTISDIDTMKDFLRKEPSFQDVYHCAIMMMKDRKELMEIMSDFFEQEDIVASLNKTNASKVKRLERELQEKDSVIKDKDSALQAKDCELLKQKELIEELKRQLSQNLVSGTE